MSQLSELKPSQQRSLWPPLNQAYTSWPRHLSVSSFHKNAACSKHQRAPFSDKEKVINSACPPGPRPQWCHCRDGGPAASTGSPAQLSGQYEPQLTLDTGQQSLLCLASNKKKSESSARIPGGLYLHRVSHWKLPRLSKNRLLWEVLHLM